VKREKIVRRVLFPSQYTYGGLFRYVFRIPVLLLIQYKLTYSFCLYNLNETHQSSIQEFDEV
jgi:hypothetical protein